jgi:ATP-binding cassette, subfamily C (CFTR/MRP), member 1
LFPEEEANVLSRISFWWINPLISIGYKRDFTPNDMWPLPDNQTSNEIVNQLEQLWNKETQLHLNKTKKEEKRNGGPSLSRCLFNLFSGRLLSATFLKIINDLLLFSGPTILGYLKKIFLSFF